MSVANLILQDNPIKLEFFESKNIKGVSVLVTNKDMCLAELLIDRSQAHLLMLWLQEHLK